MRHQNHSIDESINIASKPASNRITVLSSRSLFPIGSLLLSGLLSVLLTATLQAAKPMAPTTPSSLVASAASTNQIGLTWQDNSSNESGFIVYRAMSSSGPWTQIATTPQNVRSYSNAGLNAGTTYYYQVCAYNSRGNSGNAGPASATTPTSCSYLISPNSVSPAATGTAGTVSVTTGGTCPWSATSGDAWITITAGASGTGNGSVSYTVAANTGTSARTGTMTIAGSTFIVNQSGATCAYSLSSSSASPAATGGSGTVGVTTGGSCPWTATSGTAWITITAGASGTGNGSVTYSVAVNTSASSRSGTMTIAGSTFTVNQSGDITPPTASLTAPTSGATLSGTAAFSGSASDNIAVSRVEFWCDGSVLLGTATAAPYTINYNTAAAANGAHTFTCKAYDSAGNATTSTAIGATVNNAPPSTNSWAHCFGGTGSDSGNVVAVDGSGNSIVAGYFQGSINLGGAVLTSTGGYDLFLAKYSAAGVHIWSKRFGGLGDEVVSAIALDASGNIVLGGYFTGTASLGGITLLCAGQQDSFLAKFSPQGDPIWSQGFGGLSPDVITSIAVDSQANIIATGYFNGTMLVGTTLLSSWGQADTFLAKFASTGANVWAKNFFNGSGDYGRSVAVDRNNNIVLAGYFLGNINLGGGQYDANWLTSPGGYIAKFTAAGDHLWSKQVGGSVQTGNRIWSMALDSNGDIAVSGDFQYSTDLGGGTITATSYGSDMYVAKYSGVDGTYRWATPVHGVSASLGKALSLATDAQNNVILAGYYQGTYNFGTQQLVSAPGTQDGFVAKYTSSGTPAWARSFGSTGYGNGNSVAVDSSGSPVATGYFTGSASFAGQTMTSVGGSCDIILGRLAP